MAELIGWDRREKTQSIARFGFHFCTNTEIINKNFNCVGWKFLAVLMFQLWSYLKFVGFDVEQGLRGWMMVPLKAWFTQIRLGKRKVIIDVVKPRQVMILLFYFNLFYHRLCSCLWGNEQVVEIFTRSCKNGTNRFAIALSMKMKNY